MDNELIKLLAGIVGIFILIFMVIIALSTTIFGDLTNVDSYKPLFIILPALVLTVSYLWFKTKNK